MKLENEFTVPVDIDTVYNAMNDPERVTPCFPGASLDSLDGDDFTGTVKVKLGPVSMTYKGKGTFVERDATNHKVVVDASGRDSRGNGTASAKATLTMSEEGDKTKVNVLTEMQVTGKPAQFGRGVMADVGDKILGQFAQCLADEFGGGGAPAGAAQAGGATDTSAGSATTGNGAAPAGAGTEAPPIGTPPAPAPVQAGSGAPAPAEMPSTVANAARGDEGVKPGEGAQPDTSAPVGAAAAGAAAGAGAATAGSAGSGGSGAASSGGQARPRPSAEAIDLLDSSRDAVMDRVKTLAPAGAGVLALLIAIIWIARRNK